MCVCSIVAERGKRVLSTKDKAQLLCSLIGKELSATQMKLFKSCSGASCQHICKEGKAFSVKITMFALCK